MILLMGISGAGKGTQSQLLSRDKGFRLFPMGEILRASLTGAQRERIMKGGLLDDDEIIAIVDKAMQDEPDDHLIMDGFPRTIPQAEWLLAQVEAGRFNLSNVFHLRASREAVKQRLLNRHRDDDREEIIEERFRQYEKATEPLLEWFGQNGIKVEDIDAERSVDAVNDDLVKRLK